MFDFGGVIADSFNASLKIGKKVLGAKNAGDQMKFFEGNIAKTLSNKFSADVINIFLKDYASEIPNMPIVLGISRAITDLHWTYDLIIVSSSSKQSIENFLTAHELRQYFKKILSYENGPSKTEKISDFLKTEHLKSENCLMITDTTGDVDEARAAGVSSIAVAWGYHSESLLKKTNPAAIVERPEDLAKTVKSLLK